jgi:hypothetical protein
MVRAKVSQRGRNTSMRPNHITKGNGTMSDSTNTQGTQDQGTQPQGQDTGTNGDTAPAKVYATKAEVEAARPADSPKSLKPFKVFKAGVSVGWVLARGYDHGLATLARIDGYSLSTGTRTAPVTKEAVAAKLATFTDDELAAMGLSRKPQKGARK